MHILYPLPFRQPITSPKDSTSSPCAATPSWRCIDYPTSHYALFLPTTPYQIPTYVLNPPIPTHATIHTSSPVHMFTVEYPHLYPPLLVITHSLSISNNVIITSTFSHYYMLYIYIYTLFRKPYVDPPHQPPLFVIRVIQQHNTHLVVYVTLGCMTHIRD